MESPINFRRFLEDAEDAELYRSMVPKSMFERREKLSKMVYAAYQRGDHEAAERLDAELEDLDEKIDSMIEGMDDGNRDDDAGAEERHIDWDWTPQEEMARIYDLHLRGLLYLNDDEWVETDPSYRDDPEFQRLQKAQGHAMAPKSAYAHVPISRERALANILRGAVTDSPYSHQYGVKHDLVKSMPDEQIIAVAKDAWEWKRGIRDRIAKGRPETLQRP